MQQLPAIAIREVSGRRKDTPFEVSRVGTSSQHLLVVVRLQDDQIRRSNPLGETRIRRMLAVEMAALASDLKLTTHPHPTLSETLMEAAEVFFGHATDGYRPKKKA